MPISVNSRTTPFAVRDQDILEESFSSYINPLTLAVRKMKPLRICVDARRIKLQLTADRTKVLPLRELIRSFLVQVILPAWN